MIYVLLPAYNEEKGLPQVLESIVRLKKNLGEPLRIVVVDDGSSDKTSEVAQSFSGQLDLRLFRFEKNRGVSEVFKKGLKFVCEDSRDPDEDICVVLDSDNTQNPKVMLGMIENIRRGDDVVIASRYEGDGGMTGIPLGRWLLSVGVSWLMRLVVGLRGVKDYSTFYRAYRVRLIQRGFERYGDRLIEGMGFSVISSFLMKLANISGSISEVPCMLRYDAKLGSSGNRIFKTIMGYFRLIFEYRITNKYRSLEQCGSSKEGPSER